MTDGSFEISGYCDPRFTRVRDAFAHNFERLGEIGAAVAVNAGGRSVVDLWGGFADRNRTRPWRSDTIVNVWSTSKGVVALCAHRLAEQGLLDFEAPVTRYWPEFGAAGKERTTVAMLLDHSAGLPAIGRVLADDIIYDWDAITRILAAHPPWWEPGSRHGYHAVTFGWLVGEVIRRVSGKSVGAYLREEIAGPPGLDCYIGVPLREDTRAAEMIGATAPGPGQASHIARLLADRNSLSARAIANPSSLARVSTVNSRRWRGAEIPAANAHANARALARLYGALAYGGRLDREQLLSKESIERCFTERSSGYDEVLQQSTRFSLGFMLPEPGASWSRNPRNFGHPGAGGSIGFADPDAEFGFGYTMNKMGLGVAFDPRADLLIEAVYASL